LGVDAHLLLYVLFEGEIAHKKQSKIPSTKEVFSSAESLDGLFQTFEATLCSQGLKNRGKNCVTMPRSDKNIFLFRRHFHTPR
jgi:hypothetical protein